MGHYLRLWSNNKSAYSVLSSTRSMPLWTRPCAFALVEEEVMKSWLNVAPLRALMSSLVLLSCVAIPAVGGRDALAQKAGVAVVPRAVCGPGDHPETALQGQVPASLRASGFHGFNCNLQLIGQSRGDGANWQAAQFLEGKKAGKGNGNGNGNGNDNGNGRICAYHGTASPTASPPSRN